MKKILFLGLLFVILPFAVSAEEPLSCPTGQIVQSVEITPAVPAVPAVTHVEVVIDTPAWDEVVIDTPAYTTCDYVGAPAGDYKNSSCTQTSSQWWLNVYKKFNHPAVTHTVHHDAITHEVVVVDVPEVPGTPAVFADQCVADPNYVAPVVTPDPTPAPVKETPAPYPGGRRHCGTDQTPSCEVWIAQLNASINGSNTSVHQQLVDALTKLVALYQKLLSLR